MKNCQSEALGTIVPGICSIIITIWILIMVLVSSGDSYRPINVRPWEAETIYHVVQPGESLWSIAAQYRPDENLAAVVEELMSMNDCGSIIHPWDVIKVPVRGGAAQ